MDKRTCSVDGCDRPVSARGLCPTHYGRWRRHGDPLAPLQNYRNPVDAFTARTEWRGDCLIWTGATNKQRGGYGFLRVGDRVLWAHRYAWELTNGPIPNGMEVDHSRHCDVACCNVEHLRLATRPQNAQNLSGARDDSATGARGVFPHGSGYRVQVHHGGKRHSFGTYRTVAEAEAVAERERARLFGEFAGRG